MLFLVVNRFAQYIGQCLFALFNLELIYVTIQQHLIVHFEAVQVYFLVTEECPFAWAAVCL